MSKKIIVLLVALVSVGAAGFSQKINGHVYTTETGKMVVLEGVTVAFPASTKGTISTADGSFELLRTETDPLSLIFSYLGYKTDTVKLSGAEQHIMLEMTPAKAVQLEETQVLGYQKGTISSRTALLKTETITRTGLAKLACCNLSESFENSASITVGFTDAVSGAKQVQLLGLSSIYSQMMAENVPTMRGLASTFGWNYVPGTWLESIQISKGASSVVNGYESITGQINLEMQKPETAQPLFINLYGDLEGRYETNLTAALPLNERWATSLLAHVSAETMERDFNKDGFMDIPRSRLLNLYNRWNYTTPNGFHSQTGIKFLDETRHGGQMASIGLFSTNFTNRNFTLENKTGIPFAKEGTSVGIITNLTHYEQTAAVGKKSFDGKQNSLYANVILTSQIGDSHEHKYSLGASVVADFYKTSYLDSLIFNQIPKTDFNRNEVVTGAFGEYTFSPVNQLLIVAGARIDYNSFFRKFLFTPRANLKYTVNDNVTARLSAGRGSRSPNLISENIGLLGSSHNIDVQNLSNLALESAWNYGGNLQFSIPVFKGEILSLGLDYFHTEFENQVIIDMEQNRNSVIFYNLQGRSFADVFQADLSLTAFRGFDIYAAFRYNNTQITYNQNGTKFQKEKPLTSRFRGLLNLAYATRLRKWVYDFTMQLNGKTRLPSLQGYNAPAEYSPLYPLFFAQVTKNTKRFDVYLGCENLLDYRQQNPIIDPQNPFSADFNSSRIWGPLMGRRFYAGIRIRIGELK